ncbi:NCS2 family permease, partial [Staphylococcus aureus]|nr:NCS2 family permease [Staphylococcus aureus]
QSSGIIVKNESTLVTLGHLTDPPVLLAIFGIVITVILYAIKLPRAGRALFSDSLATIVGSVFGTTTTTSYIESTSGVAVGARTGFASIVTGCCFLLALFFSPLIAVVTSAVTTPALVVVGVLMAANFAEINWKSFEVAVPAFITIIMMPLSYSIATGIACGFIFYPITMLISKKHKEVHPIMYVLMLLFILYFIFVHG